MDPPLLPPLPTPPNTITATAITATATGTATVAVPVPTSIHLTYPDSIESFPRSRNADTYDDNNPLPQIPGAKLRLMCSYGGRIIPRPHEKSLCYVSGETRLVVVDRHSSLSSLCTRLSRSLVNGRSFTLKYQLPNEDLDSLVSITTDEDLENMIEEYDRLMATSASSLQTSSRIRLFLFFNKPETAASMGSFLDDAKSETWFVDALNGSGLLPRGHSDTTMECLLNLDSENDLDGSQQEAEHDHNKQVQYSLPDSPLVETSSSFGSSSSSPSMSNLPPVPVRVEDQRNGAIEEQFAQMSFAHSGLQKQQQQQEEGVVVLSGAPPPMPTSVANALPPVPVARPSENTSSVLSDDERSDHGVPAARLSKPPLPLQPVQYKACAAYNLPSPDSVTSDSSIASAASSLSKPSYHQDEGGVAFGENRGPSSPSTGSNIPIPSPQTQDSGNVLPAQMDQQQQQQQQQPQRQHLIHASMHYIPHHATTPVPISSYYPVYASPQQQILHHHPIDQQYPVYVMSSAQTQAPYMSVQSNIAETNSMAASSLPLTAVYKDGTPPIYPTKTAAQPNPKMQQQYLGYSQIPANQIQQQFVGYSQMQHPSQSIAVAPGANANYGYEYANPVSHEQVYSTQHQASPLPSQYQTMTAAAAVAALADASKQLPVDSSNQQIRIRPSQPL